MKLRRVALGALAGAVLAAPIMASSASAESVFIPGLTYRTGPFGSHGKVVANGFLDYVKLLNARDGGISGVKIVYEECEFGYSTPKGVECYERLKLKGAVIVNPYSTGVTNKLLPKAPQDKIPILTMGYGFSGSADGRYFAWGFNYPATYWSQASAIIKYIASIEGSLAKLKGKKIGFIYLESGYGKEPIPLLLALGKRFGFKLTTYSVPFKASADQRSQWRKAVRSKQDWMIMWGWGKMNPTAIQRASEFGFPMNRFIGVWWSGAEQDTQPNAAAAKGYRSATFHAPGGSYKVHQEIIKVVYKGDVAKAEANDLGDVLYNRGVFNAMISVEAIRYAIRVYGKKVTGTGVREGLENINISAARLTQLGFKGFTRPFRGSCADHEGSGAIMIQEWDGKNWRLVSGWIEPMKAIVRPLITEAALKKGKQFGAKKRANCK